MEDGVGEDAIQQGSKKPHPVVCEKVDSRLPCWEKQLLKAHLLNGKVSNKSSSNKNIT